MRIFFIGDIVGAPGRRAVEELLPRVVDRHLIDLVVANGENAAGGIGITPQVAEQLLNLGVDLLTSGNHIWKHKEILPYLDETDRLLRPANYPPDTPGRGWTVIETAIGEKAAIINLEGRVFMNPLECPFRTVDTILAALPPQVKITLVDMHAEATSEKQALGWYLDGRISALVGTHTHVQTADEKILPEGTAYITDVGMTGPYESVIGIEKEQIIQRFLTNMPMRFETAKGEGIFSALIAEIDEETGKSNAVQRLQLKYP
jgi:metallophosphoesterase (TIGR00282 family)